MKLKTGEVFKECFTIELKRRLGPETTTMKEMKMSWSFQLKSQSGLLLREDRLTLDQELLINYHEYLISSGERCNRPDKS